MHLFWCILFLYLYLNAFSTSICIFYFKYICDHAMVREHAEQRQFLSKIVNISLMTWVYN